VTLCVAQAIMAIPSDRRFLKVTSKHLRHLFPRIPARRATSSAAGALRTRWSG
jgi:sulfur relay (sulfurtransferase) DsrC/TusE family protein